MDGLSFIIPFFHKIVEFKEIFPINLEIIKKLNINSEIIICVDENKSEKALVSFLSKYFFDIKIIVNDNDHEWRNPSKAINVGIRNSIYDKCFVSSPESLFKIDLLEKMVKNKTKDNYIVGYLSNIEIFETKLKYDYLSEISKEQNNTNKYYGSILFSKKHAAMIRGYNENLSGWGGDDDNFRLRLERIGIKRKEIDSGVTHFEFFKSSHRNITQSDYKKVYDENQIIVNNSNWGKDFERTIII